ncbi:endonuclease/exonuclease/phosphatase family protein [Pseudonocardia humida]|uniref:Endonuclease/exonuclease/phosphatase family protein n=1 Tax=Pseudonocardia humida TaxID=2800819 RepID=A0ABT1A102_9PSEU|nr:endonuclease/exonuclease/phosphatase family protein [Pseudonocardia humida]MCO1656646.1 endonuclease/exonuclease/phosphatase family protein [Pseudonocardia humida]
MATLRVLTFNTLAPAYVDYAARRDVLRAELHRLDPDVAALQEVEPGQAADLLGPGRHAVRHRSTDPDDPVGAELVSRWPFGAVHHIDLHLGAATAVLPWTGAVAAEVLAPPPIGPLLVVHHKPVWPIDREAVRERQAVAVARAVEDLVAERPAHVVLLGDLDATPDAASVRFLTGRQSLDGTSAAYHDAWESVRGDEPGHTFTPRNTLVRDGSMPLVRPRRIDYVLVRGEEHGPTLRVRSCELVLAGPVGEVQASDHYGVLAELEPPGRPPGELV